jgi:hypothetical protein
METKTPMQTALEFLSSAYKSVTIEEYSTHSVGIRSTINALVEVIKRDFSEYEIKYIRMRELLAQYEVINRLCNNHEQMYSYNTVLLIMDEILEEINKINDDMKK